MLLWEMDVCLQVHTEYPGSICGSLDAGRRQVVWVGGWHLACRVGLGPVDGE